MYKKLSMGGLENQMMERRKRKLEKKDRILMENNDIYEEREN